MVATGTQTVADVIEKTPPRHSGRFLFILQKVDKVGHASSCFDISPGTCSAVTLPSFVVHRVEGLYGSPAKAHAVPAEVRNSNMGQWFPPWTVRREVWTDALKPCNSGISTDLLLFSELGHALAHHYRVFQRGAAHVSLRRDYLTRLRVFVSQATAMSQCGEPDDTGLSSPAPANSGSPKTIRQRDSDEELHRKSPRMTRRMHSTRMQDISAGVLSPVALSDQDPDTMTAGHLSDLSLFG